MTFNETNITNMKYITSLVAGQLIRIKDDSTILYDVINNTSRKYEWRKAGDVLIFQEIIVKNGNVFIKFIDVQECKVGYEFYSTGARPWTPYDNFYEVIG